MRACLIQTASCCQECSCAGIEKALPGRVAGARQASSWREGRPALVVPPTAPLRHACENQRAMGDRWLVSGLRRASVCGGLQRYSQWEEGIPRDQASEPGERADNREESDGRVLHRPTDIRLGAGDRGHDGGSFGHLRAAGGAAPVSRAAISISHLSGASGETVQALWRG